MRQLHVITLAADATAEKIFTFKPARRTVSLRILNRTADVGAEDVDLGFDDTVTTGNGIPVLQNKEELVISPKQDIYAIVATAADSLIVIEEVYFGENV